MGDLEFYDCKLVSVTRNGKVIYPPPEEQGKGKAQPEGEKKP
ncbi:MAG: hypothetical protein AB1696_25115 [Planctomycetota bacterium]